MSDTVEEILKKADEGMKSSALHLESELAKIRAGKAAPNMLDGIMVEYYGTPTPIGQVANISVMDSRTLAITPWEKSMIQEIERSIQMANLGINPQNDGENIKLFMPPMTEERRKDLVKQVNAEVENAKVSVRSVRRDAMEDVKKLQKDGLSEDAAKGAEQEVQKLTDDWTAKLDEMSKKKEKEIMTV